MCIFLDELTSVHVHNQLSLSYIQTCLKTATYNIFVWSLFTNAHDFKFKRRYFISSLPFSREKREKIRSLWIEQSNMFNDNRVFSTHFDLNYIRTFWLDLYNTMTLPAIHFIKVPFQFKLYAILIRVAFLFDHMWK